MISYNQALEIIGKETRSRELGMETVPLAAAAGRVCAAALRTPMDVQPFDNSAMDGFAVHMADVAPATAAQPVRLRKAGTAGAGHDKASTSLPRETCWHVMTGAPLPAGTEAVVPVENATMDVEFVIFTAPPRPGDHIRRVGEDFRKDAPLMSPGTRICATHIMPLATLGIAELAVFKKPRILFIPTGAEIVDDLHAPLSYGQIYNSNGLYAAAFLTACGADVTVCPVIRDNPELFIKTVGDADAAAYDMVVSSGAVSAGSFDFVREGLEKAGAEILFHKIKLKPGKPNLVARLRSGGLYFGLPGNPVATAAGLRFFVAPAIRMQQGKPQETPVYARTMNAFSKKPDLHMILKGRLEYWEDGSITVDILDGQESFKVSPFLSMNCWVHVPEGRPDVRSGEVVETYPLLP